jgi:subtilisin family serine protease
MSSTDRSRARHARRLAVSLLLLLALAGLAPAAASGALTPELRDRLAAAAPGERVPVVATLRDQVDEQAFRGHRAALIRALRGTAARSDVAAEDEIDAPVTRFWLVNALAARVTPEEARALAEDPAVETVDLDSPVRVAAVPTPYPDAGSGNWGLAAVGAPTVWSTYGYTGAGVRLGSIDTGVDAGNPDLAGKIVAWRDFVARKPAPYDDNGHGTHTIGTMVGGAAGGAPVGVAPGASVVVAKAIGANGAGLGSTLLAAAQWMADPDGNPATPDQPAIINNSWSAADPNDPWFRPMVQRWLELGILPVFAAGNAGPGTGTVGSPPGYPEVLAVGATSQNGGVAPFSSRGPVVWEDPMGDGPPAGTVLVKPDLVAPGVAITSTVGTGYLAYSGTSMAAPHVAGVAALVAQANPALSGAALADLVRRSARDAGPPGPDAAYGYGVVSAPSAVAAALGPAPETTFSATPPDVTGRREVLYRVAVRGGDSFRFRIDGGAWSGPVAGSDLALTLRQGEHVVEAQGLDARGTPDPTPARHEVVVDLTPPRVEISWRLRGRHVLYRALVSDALSGIDPASLAWRFPDGGTAAGAAVTRPLAAGIPTRVELRARDRAGNEATAAGTAVRAASPLRNVQTERRVSRRAGAILVRGRLTRSAQVVAALQPLARARGRTRARASARSTAWAARTVSVGAPVRRAHARGLVRTASSARPGRRGDFRLRVPVRRLAPGSYRLVITATARNGRPLGLPVVRAVRITR